MDQTQLEQILSRFAGVKLVVFGDYFLDHYLILDRSLSETSLETGLEAYQVVESCTYPGAAGTVTSNLRALGVTVLALGLYGDDGSGFELHQKLVCSGVDARGLIRIPNYATPTYIKPMMHEPGGQVHELNRMDIKHRQPIAAAIEDQLIAQMRLLLAEADGMLVIDQVPERNCGVVTDRLREEIGRQSAANPNKLIQIDSRAFLHLFKSGVLKANLSEAERAAGLDDSPAGASAAWRAERCGRILIRRTGQPAIITLGSEGLCILPGEEEAPILVPGVPVSGPIDIVGAGDSVNAAVGAAQCAGATLAEAGWIGNLVASIVIQQIGVTGTATPQQVSQRNRSMVGL